MQPMMQSLGLDRLNLPDRLTLLEEIWDSLADHPEQLEVPPWHQEEIDRRLAAREANPAAGSTWEEVRTRLEQRS